jgi:hypothetical protein
MIDLVVNHSMSDLPCRVREEDGAVFKRVDRVGIPFWNRRLTGRDIAERDDRKDSGAGEAPHVAGAPLAFRSQPTRCFSMSATGCLVRSLLISAMIAFFTSG